jgi:hypothetical protein
MKYNFATGIDARLIIDPIGNEIYTMTQYLRRQPDTFQYQDYPDADRHM